MTTIYLVRHGEAEGNAFRRIHGQYDSILTTNGFRQVQALARRFRDIPVDACFSSDLTRTSLTARAIYEPKGLRLHRDPAFREINLGRWEDVPFGYLDEFEAEDMLRFNRDPVSWYVEGAERFPEYTDRFLEGMERAAARFPGKTIAIFSHAAVLRGVLMRLFFDYDSSRVPRCDNTAVSKLFWDGERFTYEYLNDNSHVPEELSTFARQKWWRQGEKKRYNLWYQPAGAGLLPEELPTPPVDGVSFVAMLGDTPVGLLSLDENQGRILRLYVREDYRDRELEDQFLGQAVSCLRRRGRKAMTVRRADVVPDGVLDRYGFQADGELLNWNLDPGIYHWEDCVCGEKIGK